VPLHARVQVDLLKKKSLRWPRFESDQKLMTVGAYRPLDDVLRIALSELVAWIHADYGLSELDAYELLTKVATLHLAERLDPNYVIVAGVDKRYLPSRP
jgi:acetamidase/formamidase